jgi:hypothetical protein
MLPTAFSTQTIPIHHILPEYKTTSLHNFQFSEKYQHRTCLILCDYKEMSLFSDDELEKLLLFKYNTDETK